MHYVAIGDSFTEGVGDELPDGSVRGWADLVAAGLAAEEAEPVHYANLAVRGRLLAPIVTDQLEAALSLTPRPALLTLNGGGHDMMRRACHEDRLSELTARAFLRCQEAGVQVVRLSGADPTDRLPLGPVMHRRGETLTARLAGLGGRRGGVFVVVFR